MKTNKKPYVKANIGFFAEGCPVKKLPKINQKIAKKLMVLNNFVEIAKRL